MIRGAVPVFSNMAVLLTGLEVPTIVFGNVRLVVGRVTTGEDTDTTDSTTEVALYVTFHPKPVERVGRLVVPKVPPTEPAVKIVNVLLRAGLKELIRVTFSVPASVAVPVALTESNELVPPIFTSNAAVLPWL
jgi:hypothetical protein